MLLPRFCFICPTFLDEFARGITASHVTVADIVAALGERGLGLLIAVFALPNVIPTSVPGATILFGLPSFVFSIQLALGVKRLILPGFIARRRIETKVFQATARRMVKVLHWFEALLQPRFAWISGPYGERFIGGFCIVLAIGAAAPIPFGHILPALALAVIGLGLVESDGVAILLGLLIGLLGFIVAGLVLSGLARSVHYLRHNHAFQLLVHLLKN
jgi:hypothetical protein